MSHINKIEKMQAKILRTIVNAPWYCGDTRPRKFPTVSRYKALYLKSAMPTSLMCHRYPYGSFAEFSGDRTRGSRRRLLTNARDIDG